MQEGRIEEYYPRYDNLANGKILDRGKYLVFKNGIYTRYPMIGMNRNALGSFSGGSISAYSDSFDDEDKVCIDKKNSRFIKMGEIVEAYKILEDVVGERNPIGFIEICECVMEAINQFFGDYSKQSHDNRALSTERSMLAHNILNVIGINSTFKISGFINPKGEADSHAYNVVEYRDKYYIFDSTLPTLRDGIISPIVAEVPKDIYKSLINPIDNGICVRVSHYCPMTNKDIDVTYNAGWKKTYDARGSLEQKDK